MKWGWGSPLPGKRTGEQGSGSERHPIVVLWFQWKRRTGSWSWNRYPQAEEGPRTKKKKMKTKQNKIKIPLRLGAEESIQGRRDSMTLHILGLSALVSYSVEHKLGRAAHNSILRVGLIIKYRSMLPAGCITNSSMQTIHCCSPE